MKAPTASSLLLFLTVLMPACMDELDAEADLDALEPSDVDELELLDPATDETVSLTCDLDEQAAVGGLHYPNTSCAAATAAAEASLSSWHYRNACNLQVGSDIADPASDAMVTSCYVNKSGSAVVSVALCCEPPASLSCDVDEQASVGGLHYPGWTCADAIANAESTLSSWHYRNACHQQVGSDIADPAAEALVTSCTIDANNNAVVSVDLCCEPPSLSCDVDEQASVGGLHYPGWTCADAIANAESTLSSWHYRNACHQQVGSDIADPAAEALVASCTIDANNNAVVSVDLCCEPGPVEGIPDGTRKMCIEAGTAADMLADCEAGAQVNVGMYTSGTWTTQDYINHWTNPCPVGTAIVPQSQFYVANSCNPLPNVGAGCAGPGSFNYEMQIGVLCQ